MWFSQNSSSKFTNFDYYYNFEDKCLESLHFYESKIDSEKLEADFVAWSKIRSKSRILRIMLQAFIYRFQNIFFEISKNCDLWTVLKWPLNGIGTPLYFFSAAVGHKGLDSHTDRHHQPTGPLAVSRPTSRKCKFQQNNSLNSSLRGVWSLYSHFCAEILRSLGELKSWKLSRFRWFSFILIKSIV